MSPLYAVICLLSLLNKKLVCLIARQNIDRQEVLIKIKGEKKKQNQGDTSSHWKSKLNTGHMVLYRILEMGYFKYIVLTCKKPESLVKEFVIINSKPQNGYPSTGEWEKKFQFFPTQYTILMFFLHLLLTFYSTSPHIQIYSLSISHQKSKGF